jgi:archaellum component FlaG (FlaF/FlaG flagellin family)
MVNGNMNGDSKKQVLVAIVSLAVAAAVAGVLSNSKARDKMIEGSKKLVDNFRKGE